MENIIVDNCKACEPVNQLIQILSQNGFKIIEQKLEDYHFHQIYIKLVGNLNILDSLKTNGFTRIENKFICDCHWSTVELVSTLQ